MNVISFSSIFFPKFHHVFSTVLLPSTSQIKKRTNITGQVTNVSSLTHQRASFSLERSSSVVSPSISSESSFILRTACCLLATRSFLESLPRSFPLEIVTIHICDVIINLAIVHMDVCSYTRAPLTLSATNRATLSIDDPSETRWFTYSVSFLVFFYRCR